MLNSSHLSIELTSAGAKCGLKKILFLEQIVHTSRHKRPLLSTVCSKRWKLVIDCFLMKFKV